MNRNSEAILILCSHLCKSSVKPLEPKEWSDLAQTLIKLKIQPCDLLDFSLNDFKNILQFDEEKSKRFSDLTARSGSLSFELAKYKNMGINVITRADNLYPKQLKNKLKNSCPPIFYYAGNIDLLDKKYVGYVGSRTVDENDIEFTRECVKKTTDKGYGVVSGGAKGIDTVATLKALENDSFVTLYLSDSMLRKLRDSSTVQAINKGNLLMISFANPDAGFNTGIAMMRNKFIYAQSEATVVIRSDKGKGGTWAGATENLKKNYCTGYCRNYNYKGNLELIKMGAIPVDENWDGEILPFKPDNKINESEQLSLFDL